MTSADYSELTTDRPEKSLIARLVKTGLDSDKPKA